MAFRRMIRVTIFAAVALVTSYVAVAQGQPGAAASTGSASIPASSGTYSIESEILAYKALRANSAQIASEVSSLRDGRSLILVPSSSTAVPGFQLWRSHMLIVHNFLKQAQDQLQGGDGCPPTSAVATAPSFAGYTTAIGEGVTALQGILSLFANSQSVNEFTGTIQDQALILAVARELKKSGGIILTPDIYGPWTIAKIDGETFPFIKILSALIDQHSALQKAYVCNAVAATAGGQIQQAEIARETDYSKLTKLNPTDKDYDAKARPTLDDIDIQTETLNFLRQRIGLSTADLNTIQNNDKGIAIAGATFAKPDSPANPWSAALQKIHSFDVNTSNLEMPVINRINLKVAQIMSLVTGIESYLSSLTGGAITLTAPTAPAATSNPTTPTQGAAPQGGAQPGATQQASPTGATANGSGTSTPSGTTPSPSSPSSSSSAPTIVTVLQADGLAAKMGFTVGADYSVSFDQVSIWGIVWLKALESGGAIINEANILGSHPYFGGGAVSGYAFYQLDGSLICSANVASYGGYLKAKDFPDSDKSAPVKLITIGGSCTKNGPWKYAPPTDDELY